MPCNSAHFFSLGPGTWARLGDPPTSPAKYWDRRGKEELSKPETPTGMEARREGGRRQGSHCPEEIPGKEFGSPDRGSLERTRSKLLMQGNIGEDSVCSTSSIPTPPTKKSCLEHMTVATRDGPGKSITRQQRTQ